MSRPSPRERLLAQRGTIGGSQPPRTADPAVTTSAYMGRLSRQQLAQLDVLFPPRNTDNPTQVAQYLGQQQVLAKLRSDFSE